MAELPEINEWVRRYWDEDAATYDLSPEHVPLTSAQWAAWTAAQTATTRDYPA